MARLNRYRDEEDSSVEVLIRDLTTLFTNQVYMLTTLSMVLLTFTATGFQFWTISYLQVALKVEETDAQVAYIGILMTSLSSGITIGAIVTDKFGGYKAKNLKTALTICCLLGSAASLFALMDAFSESFTAFIVFTWLFLFFGSAT